MSLLSPSSPCYKTSGYFSTTMKSKVLVRPELFTKLMLCISTVFAVLRKSHESDSNGNDKVRKQSGDSGFYSTGSGLCSPPNSLSRTNAKSPPPMSPKTDRNNDGPQSLAAPQKIDAATIKIIVNDSRSKAQTIEKLKNDLKMKEEENSTFRNLIGNIKAFIKDMGDGVISDQLAADLDTAVTEKNKANASYRNLVTLFNEAKNELTAYKRTFGDEVKNSAEFQDYSSEVSRDQKLEHILKDIQEILQAMAEDKMATSNEMDKDLSPDCKQLEDLSTQVEQLNQKFKHQEREIQELHQSLKRKEIENSSFREAIIEKTEKLQFLSGQYGSQSKQFKESEAKMKESERQLKAKVDECQKLSDLTNRLSETIDIKNKEIDATKREIAELQRVHTSTKYANKIAKAGDVFAHCSFKNNTVTSEYVRPESVEKKNELSSDFDMLPLSEFTHANAKTTNNHYRGSKKAGRTESDASEIRLQMFKCENCFKVIDDESKYLKHKYICLSD